MPYREANYYRQRPKIAIANPLSDGAVDLVEEIGCIRRSSLAADLAKQLCLCHAAGRRIRRVRISTARTIRFRSPGNNVTSDAAIAWSALPADRAARGAHPRGQLGATLPRVFLGDKPVTTTASCVIGAAADACSTDPRSMAPSLRSIMTTPCWARHSRIRRGSPRRGDGAGPSRRLNAHATGAALLCHRRRSNPILRR